MNFTRAAEQCHVSQPSLTRAIARLEKELGNDLFRRERQLTHLTDFGRRMHPFLRQSYDSAQTAKTLANSIRVGKVVPLTIALSHSVDLGVLIPVLLEVTSAFPGLIIKFLRGAPVEVFQRLKDGDAELALAGVLDQNWGRLDVWPLFTEPVMALIRRDHPLARNETIELSDLRKHNLLMRPYCESSEQTSKALFGDQAMYASHEANCDDDVVKMVDAGLAVGFLPVSSSCPDTLCRRPLRDTTISRTVCLYSVHGRSHSDTARLLIKLLRTRQWFAEAH